MLFFWFFAFVVAFFCLIKFSDLVAEKSVAFAQAYGITLIGVGFLLISISTSLPELAISTAAAFTHRNGLTLGNILGSNIADVLLIGGILALATPRISRKQLKKIFYSLLLTSLLSAVLLLFRQVNWVLGIGFLLSYSLFYYNSAKESRTETKAEFKDTLSFLLSFVGLIISSVSVVVSVERIDDYLRLSDVYMGALLVSLGTSLPELSVDLAAVRKKNYSLAIGDIVGSCVFNLAFILGSSAIIAPVPCNLSEVLPLVVFLNLANLLFILAWKKLWLSRYDGIILLLFYLVFVLFSARSLVSF